MSDPGAHPYLLERLVAHGRISRRQFVTSLTAAGISAATIDVLVGCGQSESLNGARDRQADHLVLIVLDGFRPDYFNLSPTPNLEALQHAGVTYDRAWVGQLESETPTGHATITTGLAPRHDGVLGFEWRDPEVRKEVLDGWEQGALLGQVGRDMRRAHDPSIPQIIKAANPNATVVALSSEKVYAADAMGARAADFVLFHRFREQRLVPAGMPGQSPPTSFLAQDHLSIPIPLQHFHDWDDLSIKLALASLREFSPIALMINLPGSDFYGHKYGGPATPRVMAKVVAGQDHGIGQIVQEYRRMGLFDRTLFVVTADHGMVPNSRAVNGRETKAAVERAGARYLFHTGGTAKYIYLRDPSRAREVARQMARIPGVVGGYYRAPDGEYQSAPGVSVDPALDATYRYLLRTFAGSTSPDVVSPYRENTVGTDMRTAYGNHGGLSWGVQHIPLALAGPGVRRDVVSHLPARLIDVAPTVLHLLGLSSSAGDGVVLADALESPTAHQIAAQDALTGRLRAHQDVLRAQSEEDIAQDRKAGIRPPPSMSPQP